MSLLENAGRGLPAFLGVLAGVLLQAGIVPYHYAFVAIGLALLLLFAGKQTVRRFPVLGCALIDSWILAAIGMMALATAGVLWFSDRLPTLVALPEDGAKAVAGALTTYVALVLTKDISEAEGVFWPSTQFKRALAAAYESPPEGFRGDTKPYDAVYEERVRDKGPSGWGFRARWRRALILENFLRHGDPG